MIAAIAPSSPSNTRAVPSNKRCSGVRPATFTTLPFGANEPVKMSKPPSTLIGALNGCTTTPSGAGGLISAKFSAMVLPVTVITSPCNKPASNNIFNTTGTPPMRSRSVMWNFPPGFMSAICGTFAAMRLKSSRFSSTPASLAIANKCNTAFVLPPKAFASAIAFSNAFFVRMSLGRIPSRNIFTTASPARRASTSRRESIAGAEAEPGNDNPSASPIDDIVFAVNIPPHAPSPGHA